MGRHSSAHRCCALIMSFTQVLRTHHVIPFGVDVCWLSATRIRFNGLHRTVFMLCRVQGVEQRARRAWIQAAAFFCWLASAAAPSGPPSVSKSAIETRKPEMRVFLSSCAVQLVL
jgi:hypothetical protein